MTRSCALHSPGPPPGDVRYSVPYPSSANRFLTAEIFKGEGGAVKVFCLSLDKFCMKSLP